tara:strand:+ start:2085 stop:2282 length:198 start_codon:yes stop_codon:yes gene_type:complete
MKIEHNLATGEIIERELTAAELKQQEKDRAEAQLLATAKLDKAEQRAALLERLGITEEEANLLLG